MKNDGIPFVQLNDYPLTQVDKGVKYLQPEIINQWDTFNYDSAVTGYTTDGLKAAIYVCVHDGKYIKRELLKKDLSNLPEVV